MSAPARVFLFLETAGGRRTVIALVGLTATGGVIGVLATIHFF